MTNVDPFDNPDALLAAATLIEIRDATPALTRSQRKEAETERHRALIAEGYTVKLGKTGASVFRLGDA